MSIQVVSVESSREKRDFLNLPWKLYAETEALGPAPSWQSERSRRLRQAPIL